MSRPREDRGYAAVGLHNPKDRKNVGGVLRSAACFGVAMVAIAGTRYKTQRTDTAHAYLTIPLLQVDNLRSVIPYDCVPVAVEYLAGAIPLPEYAHPLSAFYIFGPEDGDLGRQLFSWCRDVVTIPTQGSLNLATAVTVVLYDRAAKKQRKALATDERR